MTLEEVICHWQHVEAEVTPDCFCIQTISQNVHERVFVLEDVGGTRGNWGVTVLLCLCVHGSMRQRVCFELIRGVADTQCCEKVFGPLCILV